MRGQFDLSDIGADGAASTAGDVARAARVGLTSVPKTLPPWLFYDARGSALFDAITELPEYYLTRAERAIFDRHGAELMQEAMHRGPATIIELGAGAATKTQILLSSALARVPHLRYVPVDVSCEALNMASARLAAALPTLVVTPWVATHDQAFVRLRDLPDRKAVLFIGSSIGNYDDADAQALLGRLRGALSDGDTLLLGTDLRKAPVTMVAAYDDRAGVTAAFNRNVLTRLNRELGADFDIDRFRHVALWNEARSRIEMHLESVGTQRVRIEAVGLVLTFADGERIHTESSVKYDLEMVDQLLVRSGFSRIRTATDRDATFAVHVARAV